MPAKDETAWKQNEDGSWSRLYDSPSKSDGPNATEGAHTAAAELGVDLASVSGSGKDGKITKADVEAAANA